jgi:hypothetical protein
MAARNGCYRLGIASLSSASLPVNTILEAGMSEELEGRVRALEALVIEMGVTAQTISAAKTRIREMARRRTKATYELKGGDGHAIR